MADSCPTGPGALGRIPELANDPYLARQPSVSGPKIDAIARLMRSGKWNWADNDIKVNGNVIIDGHHRYIAARLTGIEPRFIPSTERYAMTFSWQQLRVSKSHS